MSNVPFLTFQGFTQALLGERPPKLQKFPAKNFGVGVSLRETTELEI